ncbi:hypothetical protein C8J56DRAFT_964848 [Mycena floridula]|nr:hypothetical protein C8J56DRAFT_964848 [Mycena floridula]
MFYRSSELLLSIPKRVRESTFEAPGMLATSTPSHSRSPRPSLSFAEHSPIQTQISTQLATQTSALKAPPRHPHAPPMNPLPDHIVRKELELEAAEEDLLANARVCMETRAYARVEPLLRTCQSAKAQFLSIYSRFIVTEQQALRDWHNHDNNRHQPNVPVNDSIPELLGKVQNSTDPWLLFLKSLFLSRLSRREEAIENALLSIATFPWNWSLWSLLGSCIADGNELTSILPLVPLPPTHPLVQMFQIKTMNELHNPSENELGLCNRLLKHEFFPASLWIMSLRACVLYHIHDFEQAEAQFDRILAIDPYRVDDIDVYSNILYVTDNALKLSRVAHDFLALDKDRPEVCCLVGNHYSLRAQHEKAVKYFRRATQLDRTYLPAWTLMGHEYVEMKNSHAAIDAYRRAVDVNRKDYRAWYGLGQAYELLNMHHYALHYFQHATALRPYDVRLWQAQGNCYEEIGRPREALECLKRALIPADPHEITINLKLAKIHEDLEEHEESAAYHRRIVEVCQADMRPVPDYSKSCLVVAEYHMRIPDGDLGLAKTYLETVAASNAEDVARAGTLLKLALQMIQSREDTKMEKTLDDAIPVDVSSNQESL